MTPETQQRIAIAAVSALLAGAGLLLAARLGWIPWVWVWPGAILIVLIAYFSVLAQLARQVLLRVLTMIVPVLLIAFVVIRFGIIGSTDLTELRGALIAGSVIASGWLVTFLVSEYQREQERETMRQDTLAVLQYEIFAVLEKLDKRSLSASEGAVADQLKDGFEAIQPDEIGPPRPYHPFTASESQPVIYNALSTNISKLSERTMRPIVMFYASYSDVAAMAQDSRSEAFHALSNRRKSLFYRDLASHRRALFIWGVRALVAIGQEIQIKNPEIVNLSDRNQSLIDKAMSPIKGQET